MTLKTDVRPAARRVRYCAAMLMIALSSLIAPAAAQEPIPIEKLNRAKPVDFEKDVLPILRKNCLACHGAKQADGELVLETPASIRKGGDSGPAVVPKQSAESLLLKAAAHLEEPFMPPEDNVVGAKPLTSEQLGILQAWIDEGATGTVSTAISPTGWRSLPPGVNPIYATAISRDGQFVAASRANQIFIYHAPTGQFITRLSDPQLQEQLKDARPGAAHLDLVQSLTFNRDGDLLASGGFRTVKLWRRPRDVRTLELTLPDAVTAVAVSPDGTTFAAASADNVIHTYDRATGKPLAELRGHTGAVTALEFLPGSRSRVSQRFASASLDKTVRIWEVVVTDEAAAGRLVGRIDGAAEINGLALVDDGAAVATAGADHFARLWHVPRSLSEPLDFVPPKANVLAVSGDRRFIASANADGEIHVRDADCGQLVDRTWAAHAGAVTGLAFSANGEWIASASADKTVRVWDVLADSPWLREADPAAAGQAAGVVRERQTTLHGSLAEVTSVALRPDGKQLTSGMADGRVTVWNLEAALPRQLALRAGEKAPPTALPAEPANQKTAAADEPPKVIPPPLSHNGAPADVVAVSPDGKLLASTGVAHDRPAILVRDLTTGQLLQTLLGHQQRITALAFSPDNRRLVSGSADQTARVWELADAKFPEAATFSEHAAAVTAVAFNSNATQVVSGAANNSVTLWDVASGAVVKDFAGHTAPIVGVAMTPNNQLVITAAADKSVRFWNPADGKQARAIDETAAPTAMTASRAVDRIAVARDDGAINVYNQADGKLLSTLTGHTAGVRSLAFSPDGKRLISADPERNADACAIVWNTDDGRLLEILPAAAGIGAVTYGPAADQVILATGDAGLALHSLRFFAALGDMKEAVTALAYSPDGQSVYSSSLDGTLRRFTPANAQQAFSAAHGAPVHSLALSPNGQLLASAGDDKLLKLWNAGNGAAAQTPQLAGFTAAVNAVAFSADGTRVIGGGAAGQEVLVFNIANLAQSELEQSFVEQTGPIASIVCAGGTPPIMLSASPDDAVRRWHLLSQLRLVGHAQPVTSVAHLAGAAPQVVTGSKDGTVRRWNFRTGQLLQQLNHAAPVSGVAASADGQRIAACGENNLIRLWNAANGQQIAEMKGDIRTITALAQLTQELSLAAGTVAATKTALDAATTDAPLKTAAAKAAADALTAANTAVEQMQAVYDKTKADKAAAEKVAVETAAAAQKAALAKADADELAAAADVAAKRSAEKAARAKTAADADKDNAVLAKAAADAAKLAVDDAAKAKAAADAAAIAAKIADDAVKLATDAAARAVAAGTPFTTALAALQTARTAQNSAAQRAVVATRESKLADDLLPELKTALAAAETRMSKLTADVEVATKAVAAAEQPIRAVAFSPDSRLLASGGDSSAVHTWDAETGKAIDSFHGHATPVATLAFSAEDELLTGAADKQASLWSVEPGWKLERTIGRIDDPAILSDRVVALDFNTDGTRLAAGGGVPSRFGEFKVFDVADGSVVRAFDDAHADEVFGVAFSPDGRRIASCGADKYVKLFDLATGDLIRPYEGHTDHVLSVAWQANGKALASSGADNTIRIWNADTGDQTLAIEGFTRQVTSVRFIGETPNTLSGSGDATVRMHQSENGQNFRNFVGATDYVYSVSITPDGQTVVAGGHDSVLRLWNGTSGQILHSLAPPEQIKPPQVAATPEMK